MMIETLLPKRVKDMRGQKFGRLTVRQFIGLDQHRNGVWECDCECGGAIQTTRNSLIRGKTRSCGCLAHEVKKTNFVTHGYCRDKKKLPEYHIYRSMVQRTTNPNDGGYKNYGARGIKVCARWLGPNGFHNFYKDMGPRPSKHHSLDRKDNDGDYCPENCRWATRKEQARNMRHNHHLVAFGVDLVLAEWARRLKINPQAIIQWLNKGKDMEWIVRHFEKNGSNGGRQFLTYDGKTLCKKDWADEIDMSYNTFYMRLRAGWSLEKIINTPIQKHHKEDL